MAMGKMQKNLYVFCENDSSYSPAFFPSSVNVVEKHPKVDYWHARLGHPSHKVMSYLPSFCSHVENTPCNTCHMAKQTRLPFGHSDIHTFACFELIHVDVWGPYSVPTIFGAKYMLTIVDDFSRVTWVHLMQTKVQVPSLLATFLAYVQTQFDSRVKHIRTDNGTEFLSHNCQSLLQENGIVHQRTCTYTPQQNGVVERKHRHLIQVARALLLHAGLDQKFWGDAVLTATYIINKLPSNLLQWKSPYEVLTSKQPTLSHLRVFGSLCYATVVDHHRKKLDAKAKKCNFIGYVFGCKGYKLYELSTGDVFISRDVQFYEDIFPYNSTSDQPMLPLPLPSSSTAFPDDLVPFIEHPLNSFDPVTIPQSDSTVLPSTSSTSASVPVRRSSRPHHDPVWHKDYVTYSIPHSSVYTPPSYPYVQAACFSDSYINFLSNLSQVHEPSSYVEVSKSPAWQKAMNNEITALEENNTWELVDLPQGVKPIGCKWIYKLKLKADGSVERHKARLVAKGYNQIEGVDFTESFSPVAKGVTVKLFLALASSKGWPLH